MWKQRELDSDELKILQECLRMSGNICVISLILQDLSQLFIHVTSGLL